MKKICSLISNYFRVFFVLAFIVWISFPVFSAWFMDYVDIIVMIAMYLWFLKVTTQQLKEILHNWREIILYLMVSMVLLPVVWYFITSFIYPDRAPWIFILLAIPAGVSSIALCWIIQWNTSLSASITVWSSFLSLISIPLLTKVVVWSTIQITTLWLLTSLFIRIVVPFIFAEITKKIWKQYNTYDYANSAISILLIMPMVRAPIWINIDTYRSLSWEIIVFWVLWLFLLSVFLHILWRYMYAGQSLENKVSWSIWMWYMNLSLALLLATTYFGPSAILVILLYEFPWDLMMIPLWIIKKKLT